MIHTGSEPPFISRSCSDTRLTGPEPLKLQLLSELVTWVIKGLLHRAPG